MVGSRGRVALAIALSALMVVSTIAASGAMAAVGDGNRSTVESLEAADDSTIVADRDGDRGERTRTATEQNRSDRSETNRSGDNVEIAEGSRNAEGETQMIVQFEDPSRDRLRHSADPVETLKERSAASDRALEQFTANRDGISVDRSFWVTNAALVTVDGERTTVADLTEIPGVVEIHPNYDGERLGAASTATTGTASPAAVSNRTGTDEYTHGLETMNVPEFWQAYDTRGEDVNVAVIDSGVDEDSHSGLDVIDGGWAHFYANGTQVDSEPHDPAFSEHGTHVSGIVAGNETDDGTRYGVAPNVDLMVASDETPDNGLQMSATLAAFEWALDHEEDIQVITTAHSFGAGQSEFVDVIDNARSSGIVVTGAVGNSGAGTAGTPGDGYDVISVGAVDAQGDVAHFSGGRNVTTADRWADPPAHWPDEYTLPAVTAPGENVVSASVGGGYEAENGTSYAAPHVAGAAALLLANEPELTPDELEQRLVDSATHPDSENAQDTRYGHGIVNVSRAATLEVGTVEGTVHTDGTAEPDAVVSSDEKTRTTTADDGSYELPVAGGSVTLTADSFGYAAVEKTVTTDANGTVQKNFNLTERQPEVEVLDGQPEQASPDDTIEVTYRVGGATNVTVDATDEFDDPDNTTLTVDGNETVEYGEAVAIDESERNVTVTVGPDAGYFGTVGLSLRATAAADSASASTGPTMVNPDRIDVPSQLPDGMTIPEVVTAAGPGTTVVLEDGNYTFETGGSNYLNAAMVIGENVTVTADDDASPTVQINDTAAAYRGIQLEGEGAELTGLEIRGDGVIQLVGVTGRNAAVRNLTLRNTDDAVVVYESAAEIHGVTAVDVRSGIDAQYAGGGSEITGNVISNATRDGIIAGGPGQRVANNTVTAENEDADLISVSSPEGPVTVEDNEITGGDTGVTAYSSAPVTVRSNEIRGTDGGIDAGDSLTDGVVSHRIVDNRIVNVTQDGISLSEANGTTVAENEIVNPQASGVYVSETDDLTVHDNVVRRPDMSGPWAADISVQAGTGVAIKDNVLEQSFLSVAGTKDTKVENTTTNGANGGIAVGGIGDFYGQISHPSENVTVTGTNAGNNPDPVSVRRGTANVSVEHSDAVAKLGDDPGMIENATIGDGTTFSANGTGVELRFADDPVAEPDNFEWLSTAFDVNRTSADARLGLELDLGDRPVEDKFDGTVGLYTNDSDPDGGLGEATLEGDRLVVSDVPVDTDAQFAAFGEPAATLEGHVTANGSPHKGATVTVARNGTRLAETTTEAPDSSGDGAPYELTAPADEVVVTATDRAHTSDSTTIALTENGTNTANFSIQRVEDYVGVDDFAAPNATEPGSTYTVEANVTNLGTADGNETVAYVVDGEVVANETVELNASDRTGVTFEHSLGDAGTYEHGIRTGNETRTRTQTVEESDDGGTDGGGGYAPPPPSDPSPSFSIASVDLATTETTVGEPVTVDAQVDNDGDADGEYTATLTADGEEVDAATAEINANWHDTLRLSTSFDEPGTYQLAVDGEPAGTVTVTGEPDLGVTDASLDSSEVAPGETVGVTATVENAGSVDGETEIALRVDGEQAAATAVSAPAGETKTVTFEHVLNETGSVSLSVGGETAGVVAVEESDGDGEGDDDSGGGDGGMPGFGALAALLGLLLSAALATRRASN